MKRRWVTAWGHTVAYRCRKHIVVASWVLSLTSGELPETRQDHFFFGAHQWTWWVAVRYLTHVKTPWEKYTFGDVTRFHCACSISGVDCQSCLFKDVLLVMGSIILL